MHTTTVLSVFIAVGAIAISTIVFLASFKAREPLAQAVVSARGYAVRRNWLVLTVAVVVAVATFFVTIPHFLYPAVAFAAARHSSVVARQYSFALPESVPARTMPKLYPQALSAADVAAVAAYVHGL